MARLSTLLRSSVAAACFAAVVGAPAGGFGQPEKAAPSTSVLEVRAGQAPAFSRIEFRWAGGASAAALDVNRVRDRPLGSRGDSPSPPPRPGNE